MSGTSKFSSVVASFRAGGLRGGLTFVAHRLVEEYHERRLGIHTRGFVSAKELGHTSRDFGAYLGVPYPALLKCLAQAPISPERDAFLDIGCGMGRALLIGATKPFRRAIGVEISPALAEQARENTARARHRLRCEVEVVVADAGLYEIPDDLTVIHILNSVVGDTLVQVFKNIRASLHRKPRALRVIYGNPERFETLHLGDGWLRRTYYRRFYPNMEYAIYETERP